MSESNLPGQIVQFVLTPALERKLFSEPQLSFQRYFGCYQQIFETGAVLGHAFRNNFVWFLQFFSQPGRAESLAEGLRSMAAEHLQRVGEATSFLDLAMHHEESRIRQTWRNKGKTEAQIEERFKKFGLTQQQALSELNLALNIGLGVGGNYPELVERFWREAYERQLDQRQVDLLRKAGMTMPKSIPESIPLRQHEENLLSGVRSFLKATHPELIQELEAAIS